MRRKVFLNELSLCGPHPVCLSIAFALDCRGDHPPLNSISTIFVGFFKHVWNGLTKFFRDLSEFPVGFLPPKLKEKKKRVYITSFHLYRNILLGHTLPWSEIWYKLKYMPSIIWNLTSKNWFFFGIGLISIFAPHLWNLDPNSQNCVFLKGEWVQGPLVVLWCLKQNFLPTPW